MACETQQSQLANFTAHFFGTVEKLDLAPGLVAWSLPCGLDLGLPTSPRREDEGVSCYFLRLFQERIEELAGPDGAPGGPGAVGFSGYTVTIRNFTQPSTSEPIQVRTSYNPVIRAGSIVYINRSGWYDVLEAGTDGTLTLSLIQPMLGATGTILLGRSVVPVGPKGQDLTGPIGPTGATGAKGDQGETGDQGPAGADGSSLLHGATEQNANFIGAEKVGDFVISSTPQVVTFGPEDDKITASWQLIAAGVYLFRTITIFHTSGDNAVLYTGLYNVTDTAKNTSPSGGTNKFLPGSYTNSDSHEGGSKIMQTQCCLVTTTSNYNTIEYRAYGAKGRLRAEATNVSWVRVT